LVLKLPKKLNDLSVLCIYFVWSIKLCFWCKTFAFKFEHSNLNDLTWVKLYSPPSSAMLVIVFSGSWRSDGWWYQWRADCGSHNDHPPAGHSHHWHGMGGEGQFAYTQCFKGITFGVFSFHIKIRNPTIMHWDVKWHKLHV